MHPFPMHTRNIAFNCTLVYIGMFVLYFCRLIVNLFVNAGLNVTNVMLSRPTFPTWTYYAC